MDQFGIGAAVLGAAEVYFMSARRSGRSTFLVNSLNEGDLVVCASRGEAEHLRRLCRDVCKKVDCIYIPLPEHLGEIHHRLMERGAGGRRVVFDHGFIEEWHKAAIKRSVDDLARFSASFGYEVKQQPDSKAMENALSQFGVRFFD